jgi:hypothetical protein
LDGGYGVNIIIKQLRTNIKITTMVINNHMVVIQVYTSIITIDDVLLDGGSRVNIIIK